MAGPKPLWVTSFSDRILHQSGIPLVQSYLQNENAFDFLLGLEHVNYKQLPLSPLFQHHNVLADDFLKQWLEKTVTSFQFNSVANLTMRVSALRDLTALTVKAISLSVLLHGLTTMRHAGFVRSWHYAQL